VSKTVALNAYQKVVVDFRQGYAVCVAAPGSGKTAVMVERLLALIREGVPPKDILSLTFTKEGAKELTERADLDDVKEKVCSTFHSWALGFIKREAFNLPFKVKTDFHGHAAPLLLPLEACRLLATLCRGMERVQWKDAQSFISRMKRRGISPAQAFDHMENDGEEKFIKAYQQYERALRDKGVLDFDSIVIETANLLRNNEEVRNRNQFRFVQVDEAQDTDSVQLDVVKSITSKHGNCLFVGDDNQCQPPETLVTDYEGKQVRLGSLCEHNQVRSWTHTEQRVYKTGRKIKVASRWYKGALLTLKVGDKETRTTPGHQVWVRFTKAARGARIVYLMWRSDLGFRVGTTWLRNKHGHSMFMHRGLVEKAERLWILSVEKDAQAQAKEQMVTVKYGIPYSGFEPPYTPMALREGNGRTPDLIKSIFACANPDGGYRCLTDHGRSWEHPFVSWPTQLRFRPHGYFKTTAANLLPLFMELPTPKINGSCVLDAVTAKEYEGLVCSLDVEKDHTYIADGIVVGNCMYTWRGAVENLTQHVLNTFPNAKTFPLPINYRSTQEIVRYCQEIAPLKNETVTNLSTPNEQGVEPTFRLYGREDEEAKAVILGCQDHGNTAILARTNRQLAAFENECAQRNIRYKLLGKSGFWSQHEVKDVVAMMSAVVRPTDACVLRTLTAKCEATKFVRKADTKDKYGNITHRGVPGVLKEMAERDGATVNSLLLRYHGDGSDGTMKIGCLLRELRGTTKGVPAGEAMKKVVDAFGALSVYDEDDDNKDIDNDPRDNIMKIIDYAMKKRSLEEFYEWTQKVQRSLRARTNCLTLSTIHQSKGKEWPYVFVVGVNQDVLPHIKGDLPEEHRIYFVACSRAAKKLHVSASGVASELIRHKLPEGGESGKIDPWAGWELTQR